MKLSIALIATLSTAVSAHKFSETAKKSIFSRARRLEDANNNDDQEDEEEYAFLMNYELKMRKCIPGETVRNSENGEYEYNAVVFRLCPKGECNDENSDGCSEGYGDYVVGLNTYVQQYMEDQRDNLQYDDNFKVDEYAECREYENDNDDGNGNAYYIGPACTEDGTDIKLELYYDETCTNVPQDITFEDVSNGWSLPYSDGGLVSTYCSGCAGYNDDGDYEAKDMCMRLYEGSGKCETQMEYYHYYGKQEGYCDYILELVPPVRSSGAAGKIFRWFLFIIVVGAIAGYVVGWKQKKAAGSSSDGLMA